MGFIPHVLFLLAFFLSTHPGEAPCAARTAPDEKGVWVLVFSSSKCPRCRGVDHTLDQVKKKYPVEVQRYDVSKPEDGPLFRRFEAIHSVKGFDIPLVVVGDSILMGEGTVKKRLEAVVRKAARSGGASPPYLGEDSDGPAPGSRCPSCERRPPTLQEELDKIRKLLGGVF
jgi:thiol-disulfide isomerase/thioredoxin